MASLPPLAGVLPILQTPFKDDDAIDWPVLQREVDWAIAHGANGLGTGMVSEIAKLTVDERREYANRLIEFAAGRVRTFMAVTAADEATSYACALDAKKAGCAAIMAAPPLEKKLSPDELFVYFKTLADSVELPLIVQDASGYMGQPIPLSLYVDLLERYGRESAFFKPEAPPNGPNISKLRDASRGKARIFEGSGGVYLIDSYRRGVAGTMPGTEVVDGIAAVWKALADGDEAKAYRIYFPICSLVALQLQAGLDGFLAVEKHLLVKRGVFKSARRRQPIVWGLDVETAAEVDRLFNMLQRELEAGP